MTHPAPTPVSVLSVPMGTAPCGNLLDVYVKGGNGLASQASSAREGLRGSSLCLA